MDRCKVGIVGCGNMAQLAHLPALLATEGVCVGGLCDVRVGIAESLCKRHGIARWTTSFNELLSWDLDAVFILTPVQCHLAQCEAALAAGKHVFVEKPLAMCHASAQRLLRAAETAERTLRVGYMKRHEANVGLFRDMQSQASWGRLLFARAHAFIGRHWDGAVTELVKPLSAPPAPLAAAGTLDPGPEWLAAPRDARFYSFDNPFYGLLDTGVHSVNLLRHVTGKRVAVLSAENRNGVRVVRFDLEGAPATMEFCVNFAMRRWDEVTELYYENASVRILTPPPLSRQESARIEIYTEDGEKNETRILDDTRQWAFLRQSKAFTDSLRHGAAPSDTQEACDDLAVIESIFRTEQNNG